MFSGWREDARQGRRPGVIFNATIADTGQRLLFTTSSLSPNKYGGRNFAEVYEGKDVSVVTAARLSATFPYVMPAARADLGGPAEPQFHVVDGGYYDNYGVSSLAEWLGEALSQAGGQVKRVLILQIRYSPVGKEDTPTNGHKEVKLKNARGWFYQAYAPIATLLHVRNAGQYSHNEVELGLLSQVLSGKCVAVESAAFEFPDADAPLSWHLTEAQKRKIESRWSDAKNGEEWKKVKDFLSAQRRHPCRMRPAPRRRTRRGSYRAASAYDVELRHTVAGFNTAARPSENDAVMDGKVRLYWTNWLQVLDPQNARRLIIVYPISFIP